jgi:hypothetical protein
MTNVQIDREACLPRIDYRLVTASKIKAIVDEGTTLRTITPARLNSEDNTPLRNAILKTDHSIRISKERLQRAGIEKILLELEEMKHNEKILNLEKDMSTDMILALETEKSDCQAKQKAVVGNLTSAHRKRLEQERSKQGLRKGLLKIQQEEQYYKDKQTKLRKERLIKERRQRNAAISIQKVWRGFEVRMKGVKWQEYYAGRVTLKRKALRAKITLARLGKKHSTTGQLMLLHTHLVKETGTLEFNIWTCKLGTKTTFQLKPSCLNSFQITQDHFEEGNRGQNDAVLKTLFGALVVNTRSNNNDYYLSLFEQDRSSYTLTMMTTTANQICMKVALKVIDPSSSLAEGESIYIACDKYVFALLCDGDFSPFINATIISRAFTFHNRLPKYIFWSAKCVMIEGWEVEVIVHKRVTDDCVRFSVRSVKDQAVVTVLVTKEEDILRLRYHSTTEEIASTVRYFLTHQGRWRFVPLSSGNHVPFVLTKLLYSKSITLSSVPLLSHIWRNVSNNKTWVQLLHRDPRKRDSHDICIDHNALNRRGRKVCGILKNIALRPASKKDPKLVVHDRILRSCVRPRGSNNRICVTVYKNRVSGLLSLVLFTRKDCRSYCVDIPHTLFYEWLQINSDQPKLEFVKQLILGVELVPAIDNSNMMLLDLAVRTPTVSSVSLNVVLQMDIFDYSVYCRVTELEGGGKERQVTRFKSVDLLSNSSVEELITYMSNRVQILNVDSCNYASLICVPIANIIDTVHGKIQLWCVARDNGRESEILFQLVDKRADNKALKAEKRLVTFSKLQKEAERTDVIITSTFDYDVIDHVFLPHNTPPINFKSVTRGIIVMLSQSVWIHDAARLLIPALDPKEVLTIPQYLKVSIRKISNYNSNAYNSLSKLFLRVFQDENMLFTTSSIQQNHTDGMVSESNIHFPFGGKQLNISGNVLENNAGRNVGDFTISIEELYTRVLAAARWQGELQTTLEVPLLSNDSAAVIGNFSIHLEWIIDVEKDRIDQLNMASLHIVKPPNKVDAEPNGTAAAKEANKAVLAIRAVKGENLLSVDRNGLSDPYCMFKLEKNIHKLPYQAKTLNPSWQSLDLTFNINDVNKAVMLVQVWDKDLVGSNDMGSFEINLKSLMAEDSKSIERGKRTFKVGPRKNKKDGVEENNGTLEIDLELKILEQNQTFADAFKPPAVLPTSKDPKAPKAASSSKTIEPTKTDARNAGDKSTNKTPSPLSINSSTPSTSSSSIGVSGVVSPTLSRLDAEKQSELGSVITGAVVGVNTGTTINGPRPPSQPGISGPKPPQNVPRPSIVTDGTKNVATPLSPGGPRPPQNIPRPSVIVDQAAGDGAHRGPLSPTAAGVPKPPQSIPRPQIMTDNFSNASPVPPSPKPPSSVPRPPADSLPRPIRPLSPGSGDEAESSSAPPRPSGISRTSSGIQLSHGPNIGTIPRPGSMSSIPTPASPKGVVPRPMITTNVGIDVNSPPVLQVDGPKTPLHVPRPPGVPKAPSLSTLSAVTREEEPVPPHSSHPQVSPTSLGNIPRPSHPPHAPHSAPLTGDAVATNPSREEFNSHSTAEGEDIEGDSHRGPKSSLIAAGNIPRPSSFRDSAHEGTIHHGPHSSVVAVGDIPRPPLRGPTTDVPRPLESPKGPPRPPGSFPPKPKSTSQLAPDNIPPVGGMDSPSRVPRPSSFRGLPTNEAASNSVLPPISPSTSIGSDSGSLQERISQEPSSVVLPVINNGRPLSSDAKEEKKGEGEVYSLPPIV